MIFVRLALYLSLTAAFGLAAFDLWARPVLRLRRWLAGCVVAALGFSFVSLLLLAAQMGGGTIWPIDWDTIQILLGETALGTAWLARASALLIAGIAVRFQLRILTLLTGAIALASLAWAGHGAMDDGTAGWLHLSADILHLLASGIWIGALIGLILLVTQQRADPAQLARTYGALRGFAPIGTAVVAVLIVTGLVNAWLLVGPAAIGRAVTTLYGGLLLLKLLLFATMLGLAAANRFRLTPRFHGAIAAGDARAALHALRVSLAAETGAAVMILAIVAWIGTIEPPVSLG